MNLVKKLLFLFEGGEKKKLISLLFFIIIMAIFEVGGLASIMPFIALLTDPKALESNKLLMEIYLYFNFEDKSQFLLNLGYLILILILGSSILKAFVTFWLQRFSLITGSKISSRLVKLYLNQSYSWYINRSDADLFNKILTEVPNVIGQVLNPFLNLIAQSFVSTAIIITLLIVNPFVAITVFTLLAIVYILILKFSKELTIQLGRGRLNASKSMQNILSQSFGAFKEIKLAGLETSYSKKFAKYSFQRAHFLSISKGIGILPKYLIEALSIGGIIAIILFLLSTDNLSLNKTLPLLSLYVFAMYKLLPSLQQIYIATNSLRFASPALDIIFLDLLKLKSKKLNNNYEKKFIFKNKISIINVDYKYPKSKKNSLNNLNLNIDSNSINGLVGSTGSGKTTIANLLLGLINPQKGYINIDGLCIEKIGIMNWRKSIGYVPQNIYLLDSSIRENIAFGVEKSEINSKLIERASRLANLNEFINNLPMKYDTKVGERGIRLSGGQIQRIGIARALYNCPKVLILDEATSALDNITENVVMESINNLGEDITIILIAHRLTTLKRCDKIFVIEGGSVKDEGKYEDLKKTSKIFKQMSN